LNPVVKVGRQMEEAIRLHTACSREEAREKTLEIFREVEIPEPESRCNCYPHQLSGGLRQRVMIAMAMVCRPKLLIADEPTTALDVTVEAQILALLERLRDTGTSVLIISHNLGVIAKVCDYVYVMYAGRIVEQAETNTLFACPAHPYTRGLFRSVASLREGSGTLETIPGVVPNLLRLPAGCSFSLRCGQCLETCRQKMPELIETEPGHKVRCFLTGKEGTE
ncbi:MAG: ABC transporter ATP-binding protein, partial [Eubacteriales bacterium]